MASLLDLLPPGMLEGLITLAILYGGLGLAIIFLALFPKH